MKVLWFSVTPVLSGEVEFESDNGFNGGGWIDSLLKYMPVQVGELEIYVCYLKWGIAEMKMKKSSVREGITYVVVPSASPYMDKFSEQMSKDIFAIYQEVKPDIVHLFGTETVNTNNVIKIVGKEKCLISLTGLISFYSKHYFAEIYQEMRKNITLRDLYKGSIFKNYKKFCKNAETEVDTLEYAKYVTGRTSWDYAGSKLVNSELKYYFCNENLRDSFYEHIWKYEECEKYSIFASSSASPLKGFHKLLDALPYVLKKYPQTKVYVTGEDCVEFGSLYERMKRTGYQKFLASKIKKMNLENVIQFTGPLSEKQMADRCVKSNVYVLASCIENSPNSLCEAMLMGVPSVAANVGGVSNLIISGEEGFTYPFSESYTLAYRIMQLFEDVDLCRKFSQKARCRAMERHDRMKNAETMKRIYQNILEVEANEKSFDCNV